MTWLLLGCVWALVSCSEKPGTSAAPAPVIPPLAESPSLGSGPGPLGEQAMAGDVRGTEFWRSEGTKEMAQLLERVAGSIAPTRNGFQNVTNAMYIKGLLAGNLTLEDRLEWSLQYPIELLRAGYPREAAAANDQFEAFAKQHYPDKMKAYRRQFLLDQAMCWLRVGEVENCLENHTIASCLFPLTRAGVHTLPAGSRAALPFLTTLLEEFPTDLSARWLLNIAHMTLGDYPDQVPAAWLIPPSVFESEHDIKRFEDVASKVGVDVFQLSGGSVLDDFDNDGYLDLMVTSIGLRDQMRFFRNERNGVFSDRTLEAGLKGLVGGLNMVQADYDNDGFLDVFVLRGGWFAESGHHPNSLLRNNGNGTFSDVTKQARVMSYSPTQTAVWLDFNGDGWLDLYVGNETLGVDRNGCELYRNNRDGTFTECGGRSGVRHYGFVKAVVSADYNNDGWPDLFLSNLDQSNVLYRNDGPAEAGGGPDGSWRFTEVSDAGVAEPKESFPAWFFDYDNDGWEDLFVAGYRVTEVGDVAADYLKVLSKGETSRLFRNNQKGGFVDVSKEARMDRVLLAMGSNYGDFDNDGWLDCYLGTGNPSFSTLIPNVALRNNGGKVFQDVTTSGGLGHLQKGHGVSFGDIDQDGDQDVHAQMGGAYSADTYPNALFENPGHGHRWITLKLEGTQSNRSAIGARIKVVTRGGEGTREIHRTVRSGGSFGASPLRQEIGLGRADGVERVEIVWPARGATQVIAGLEMDKVYRIREGEDRAEVWELKPFKLGANAPGGGHGHAPTR